MIENKISTHSKEETFALGWKIGESVCALLPEAGLIVTLDGDLGAGKTAFVGGLARGLGIEEPALSPSFTIVREYQGPKLALYHIDLYRLNEVSDLSSFDFYEYAGRSGSVTAIEWAGKFGSLDYLPEAPRIEVFIEIDGSDPDNSRIFTLNLDRSGEKLRLV